MVGLELHHVARPREAGPDVALGEQRRVVVAGELADLARTSTAFLIVATARFQLASVTWEGSSPFASITSPIVSAISVSSVTLPLNFGFVRAP